MNASPSEIGKVLIAGTAVCHATMFAKGNPPRSRIEDIGREFGVCGRLDVFRDNRIPKPLDDARKARR